MPSGHAAGGKGDIALGAETARSETGTRDETETGMTGGSAIGTAIVATAIVIKSGTESGTPAAPATLTAADKAMGTTAGESTLSVRAAQ